MNSFFVSFRARSVLVKPSLWPMLSEKNLMQIKLKYSVQERFQMLNNWVAWGLEYKYSPLYSMQSCNKNMIFTQIKYTLLSSLFFKKNLVEFIFFKSN